MTCPSNHSATSVTTNTKTQQQLHICQWCLEIVKIGEPTGVRKQLIEVSR